MRKSIFQFLLITVVTLLISCHTNNTTNVSNKLSEIKFEKLLCDSKENPTLINTISPNFSWVINADGYHKSQSSYQLIVASTIDLLNEANADLWNSKKVSSSKSTYIKYAGLGLQAEKEYWWKVKIWDESGNTSEWSKPQSFKTGLLAEVNWSKAKWIALSKDDRVSEHSYRSYKTGRMKKGVPVKGQSAAYFRNTIKVGKKIKKATVYVCGLGYYELYLNGQKVEDHVLDPAPSNYDKQSYYVDYNVLEHLKLGVNSIGVIVGNGFYGQDISWKRDPEASRDMSYGTPAVRLKLKVEYNDSSTEEFVTNEAWKESTGPIVFNNIYGGDTYDARYELGNWTTPEFDDATWRNAKVVYPKVTKLSGQQIPAIKKLKEFTPKRIFKGPTGNWIVDFGQNIAGWVKIKVKETKGKLIEITTTEALTQDGKDIYPGSTGGGANGMRQVYKYVCKGGAEEEWEPKFSYHGFRYAEIKGLTTKPTAATITSVLVATDIQEKGSFSCSEPLFNKMHAISKWTVVDNVHGIPEDCPHREKCGWLGDAHAFCEYALYNYNMEHFYKKYMEDIKTQMRPVKAFNDPLKKFNVPTMIAPGKRTSSIAKLDWGIATMYLPWYNYLYYGDKEMVSNYYKDMKGLTDYYLSFKDAKGIIQNGMGDWCPPRWDRRSNPKAMECHPVVSANAYFIDVLEAMEAIAKINGDAKYADFLNNERAELKQAFNKVYLKEIPNTTYKWYGSQTATVMALQFNAVPQEEIENVVNGLVYDINVVKKGHHSTGIHGNRYIYTVLSKYGKPDLAYDILTTPEFPSQTYVMNYGFTTWPERQFEWETMKGLSNSLNHPMHSGFAAYFFECIGGIKSSKNNAGFKEFNVNPIFPSKVTNAEVVVPTPYGDIANSWVLESKSFTMNLKVPFNTKANVKLSSQELKSLKINGEKFSLKENKYKAKFLDGNIVLGSGSYQIQYTKD
ncbi:family 78 glycoside hydrolase catalytic domain [Wenyingzhuangia sp. IMCC45574]